MRIVVCIKQVPDTDKIETDPKTNSLVRKNSEKRLNRNDENAIEQALLLKDTDPNNIEIIALTMGLPESEAILRQAMAMGADCAFMLCDKAFTGADTFATALVLSQAIRKIGDVNLVITGQFTSDGNTGQVPAEMAEMLGIAQASFSENITFENNKIYVDKRTEFGIESVEMDFPALTAISERTNQHRNIKVDGIRAACENVVTVWNMNDLGLQDKMVGIAGSPTQVEGTFTQSSARKCFRVEGVSEHETVTNFLNQLLESDFVGGANE